MSELNFGIRIGARDDSQGILRGALSGFQSFARTVARPITIPLRVAGKGLAILRDINLGLAPIVRGLDNIIERGTGLEVVRKSFESLTGTGGRQAEQLARQMVQAANGTLRYAKAMQIANRALSSGLNIQQILTTLDFISKKAITTGISAETAIDKVITGLARGSVLFLDDFGLVVDGLEGITRAYDGIKGAGAFDDLGPAAQKAAIVNQAITEMRQQLGRIGVTGNETIFIWQGLKNQMGDAVDKLFMAVGRSESLKNVLKGARDVVAGMVKHLEGGGSLGDLLWGKEGGKSGGLFGFLKAGILDLGEVLGRGILGGLLKGVSQLPALFDFGWQKIKEAWSWAMDELPKAITAGLSWLKTDFLPALKQTLIDTYQWIIGSLADLFSWFGDEWEILKDQFSRDGMFDPGSIYPQGKTLYEAQQRAEKEGNAMRRRPSGMDGSQGYPTMTLPFSLAQVLPIAAMGGGKKSLAELAGEKGGELLKGGILGPERSRTGTWWDDYKKEFSSPAQPKEERAPISFLDPASFPLGQRTRLRARREQARLERKMNTLDQSDAPLNRQADRMTTLAIADLRRMGRDIRPGDRKRIHAEILGNLNKERDEKRRELMARWNYLNPEPAWRKHRRDAGIGAPSEPVAGPAASGETGVSTATDGGKSLSDAAKAIKEEVKAMRDLATEVAGSLQAGIQALTGEGARLGRAS
ncbi:MAG: hypothetical protein ABII12_03125 [Planctomycetota bacterium]